MHESLGLLHDSRLFCSASGGRILGGESPLWVERSSRNHEPKT